MKKGRKNKRGKDKRRKRGKDKRRKNKRKKNRRKKKVVFDKSKTDIKSARLGKAICGGLRFDKDALPNGRLRAKNWVQCYIDHRDSKPKKDQKCKNLIAQEKVCKGLGGVKDKTYGCYHGKTGDKHGAIHAYNEKGKHDVVQKSCKKNVGHKVTFKKAKFEDDDTTFGICVQCAETACWCKAPGKSRAIACLDGSKKSCGRKKCIEKGVFPKKNFKDGCEPSGGILKTVTVNTWFLPEKMSWKILKQKGRKTVCKSKPYDKWYSKIEEDVSRCRLTPGVAYILQCRDKYGSGWAGGSIVIQGVSYCGDGYKFNGGYKKERVFVVKGKKSKRRKKRNKRRR